MITQRAYKESITAVSSIMRFIFTRHLLHYWISHFTNEQMTHNSQKWILNVQVFPSPVQMNCSVLTIMQSLNVYGSFSSFLGIPYVVEDSGGWEMQDTMAKQIPSFIFFIVPENIKKRCLLHLDSTRSL